MTEERKTQRGSQATANHDRHELTEADLTQVAGGIDGPPGSAGDGNGIGSPTLFKASPHLF